MCPFHYITLFSVHQIWEDGNTDFNDTEKNNTESSDTEIISYPNGKNGKRENLSETKESFTYPAGDTSCKDDE